jgi:hypothetical protein
MQILKDGRGAGAIPFYNLFYYHEEHEDNEGNRHSGHNITHEVNTVISSDPSW